jgi:transcriptional regulator with XRE-family HTH domain
VDVYERKALGYVAANMRRHRRSAKKTQAALAEAVGVDTRFVQAIEAGREPPSFRTLVAIARELGIEVRDLFEPAKALTRNPGRPRRES